MNEGAHLLRMLARIQRRARRLAALEGVVAGGALGAGGAALAAVLARAEGGAVAWRAAMLLAGAGAAVGGVVAGARRVSLVRCARQLDAAIDRGKRPRDRALSALSFVDGPLAAGPRGSLARAAIADTVARARAFAPAVVAPAARPRALPALAASAIALVVVGVWPARAPAARHAAPTSSLASEPKLRVAPTALDAERDELGAVSDAARANGDERLMNAARVAQATLAALADGTLGRADVLERLAALAIRAREAAEEAERAEAALRAAGQALEPTAATRALGRALGADDPAATEQALRALADHAAASDSRAETARALATAAAGVSSGRAGDDETSDEPATSPRRLAREQAPSTGEANGASATATDERRLERLRRDLDDAAAACHGDAVACARQLRESASDVPALEREARQGPARRRLEAAVQQLRERVRRGDLDPGADARRFARAAKGAPEDHQRAGEPGGETGEAGGANAAAAADDPAMASNDDDVFADEPATSGDGARGGVGPSVGAGDEGGAARGQGYGHENGADPLGLGATPPTRGHEREAHLRDGAGPTRSEVIEASARRGFAARDYVRVFRDYEPVVEEALAAAAVPEGRRYIVRRYFQLIRPRAKAGAP